MKALRFYFCRRTVTKAAKENFNGVIRSGVRLLKNLKNSKNADLQNEVENYLVACEESIVAVGIELRSEFCEIMEILDEFRSERLLVMKYVNGELNEEMFK